MTNENLSAQLRSDIAGVAVIDLAKEFGTPAYFYDAAVIQERIEELRSFDVIRFAQKACSNIAIIDLVRRHGVRVDAVDAVVGDIGEIHIAVGRHSRPLGELETAGQLDRLGSRRNEIRRA